MPSLTTLEQRRRAVALVVSLTANTRLAPQHYERQLLTRFEQGELTLDHMQALLEASVHQVLYHSRVTTVPTLTELQELLDWSQRHNTAHGITGLLLYSEGRYVQVLEGPEAAVEDLYAHIQRDTRHTQVETVSQGPGPRRFDAWSMELGHVTAEQLEQALLAVQVPGTSPRIIDPRLQALLQAFM